MQLITERSQGLRPLSENISNQVVVVNHTSLDRSNQSPRFQLLKVTGGLGASSGRLGQSIFGIHIADGRDGTYKRSDLIGEAQKSLIDYAMQDDAPVQTVPLNARIFMLVAKDGNRTRGDTVTHAMQRLRRVTQSPVLMAYRCHPNTKVLSTGYLTYPEGAPPELVMLKKQGEEWTAISAK
jgi:hypothetical protein